MRHILISLALAVAACSGDDSPKQNNTASQTTGANNVAPNNVAPNNGTPNNGTPNNGTPSTVGLTSGPPGAGWERAYLDGGAGFGCDSSFADLDASDVPRLSFADATLFVGFEQIGDNQNPLVARFDGDTQTYCVRHETEGPDGRAWGLTWDGGEHLYVVYTVVGGGTALEGKGWLGAYAPGAISGGGPRVSYVGRVRASDGQLTEGTFVIAVKSDNKVNSHGPAGPPTVLEGGNVEFLGGSAHKPIDADGRSAMDCTDYPFDSRYVFAADLQSVVCAECTNCVSQQPCQ